MILKAFALQFFRYSFYHTWYTKEQSTMICPFFLDVLSCCYVTYLILYLNVQMYDRDPLSNKFPLEQLFYLWLLIICQTLCLIQKEGKHSNWNKHSTIKIGNKIATQVIIYTPRFIYLHTCFTQNLFAS